MRSSAASFIATMPSLRPDASANSASARALHAALTRSRTRDSDGPRAGARRAPRRAFSPSPNWNRFCAAVSRSFGSSCTVARYARPRSVKNSTPATCGRVDHLRDRVALPGFATFAARARPLGHGPHVPACGHGHRCTARPRPARRRRSCRCRRPRSACGAAPCARRGSRSARRGSRPSARRAWRGCASSSLIVASSSFFSSSSSSRPSCVSRPSGMSRMWLAWISEKPNRLPMRPCAPRRDPSTPRIAFTTASIMSSAFTSPSTMCSRVLGLLEAELRAPGDDDDLVVEPAPATRPAG